MPPTGGEPRGAGSAHWKAFVGRLFRLYYAIKFFPFRKERRARLAAGAASGFVGIQIDGLSAPHLQQALARGYLPHIGRLLRRGYQVREYQASLPSTTPAAQAAIFYGEEGGIPAFRWFDKQSGQLFSCNDPDHVQIFREQLFAGRQGLLHGGSSYANILDGDAARSIFTVSSPHPQTLFGRFGGLRIVLLTLLHPLRLLRLAGATVLEYFVHRYDRRRYRQLRRGPQEGLFPLIRIFCNVILRELQTFGVIADIYAGVPAIYTTYSGYDELAHHFGPGSKPALKNLKYTDQRLGEIMRMLRYSPGADYQLFILSDHGQTPGYPFRERFGATLGEAVSAFLRENQEAAVAGGRIEFTHLQLGYLQEELNARQTGWRHQVYRATRDFLQRRIHALVPETLKVDAEGGVVITYSSSLAHLYFTGEPRRLLWPEMEETQALLLRFLSRHKGIGFGMAQGEGGAICFFHHGRQVQVTPGVPPSAAALEFLRPYGDPAALLPDLCRFAAGPTCGDLILFGAYDGREIACFDDQVGGHGSIGGEQLRPFLLLPAGHPLLARAELLRARLSIP